MGTSKREAKQQARAAQIPDIVRMYREEKLTIREIADRVGRSYGATRNDLVRGGVKFQTGWSRHPKAGHVPVAAPVELTDEQQAIAREIQRKTGLLLRDERLKQHLTQVGLAGRLGIGASVLCRLELGHWDTRLFVYLELATALGVDLSDIVRAAEQLVLSADEAEGDASGSDELDPDDLWLLVEPLLPTYPARPQGGGKRHADLRAVFAALVHVVTTQATWRQIPADLGVAPITLWRWWRKWTDAGVWERLLECATRQNNERAATVARAALARAGTTIEENASLPSTASTASSISTVPTRSPRTSPS